MENELGVFAKRFKQIIGRETQTSIAEKIHSHQPNISKLLRNKLDASLTVENLILISKQYNVSVDWLLGLSDEKKDIIKPDENMPYEFLLCIFANLYEHNAIQASVKKVHYGEFDQYDDYDLEDIKISDPVLQRMIAEIINNRGTDISIFLQWLDKYWEMFKGIKEPYWEEPDDIISDFAVEAFNGCLQSLGDYVRVICKVTGQASENNKKTGEPDK